MKQLSLIIIACLNLIGCASNYVPPAGPTAQLLVPAGQHVTIYKNSRQCLDETTLASNGIGFLSTPAPIASRMPANTLVTIAVLTNLDRVGCRTLLSFTPQANQTYALKVDSQRKGLVAALHGDMGQCSYSIVNTNNNTPLTLLPRKMGAWRWSQDCVDGIAQGKPAVGSTVVTQAVNIST